MCRTGKGLKSPLCWHTILHQGAIAHHHHHLSLSSRLDHLRRHSPKGPDLVPDPSPRSPPNCKKVRQPFHPPSITTQHDTLPRAPLSKSSLLTTSLDHTPHHHGLHSILNSCQICPKLARRGVLVVVRTAAYKPRAREPLRVKLHQIRGGWLPHQGGHLAAWALR